MGEITHGSPDTEVHVWHAELSRASARIRELAVSLSEEERRRAARLIDPAAATRFVAARGILREILGDYLDMRPGAIRFRYEALGKPCLAGASELHFNVSHAEDRLLVAVSSRRLVGIDMERLRPLRHAERVARRVFPEEELRSWLTLPEAQRVPGFFERWTRMEALAKLSGRGVWRLLAEGPTTTGPVSFHPLEVPAEFVATLAVEGASVRLRQRQYRS